MTGQRVTSRGTRRLRATIDVLEARRLLDAGARPAVSYLDSFTLSGDAAQMQAEIATARQRAAGEIQAGLAEIQADRAALTGLESGARPAAVPDQATSRALRAFGKALTAGQRQLGRDGRKEQVLFNKLATDVGRSAAATTPAVAMSMADPGGSTGKDIGRLRKIADSVQNTMQSIRDKATNIGVNLHLTSPALAVSPDSGQFQIDQGGTPSLDGQFTLSNNGSSSVQYKISFGGELAGALRVLGGSSPVITAQGSQTLTYTVDPPSTLSTGQHTGTITFTDVNVPADQATFTVTVNVKTPAQHQADLSVSIQPSAPAVTVGQAITYTITATNLGPQDAQEASVSVELPGGLTVASATDSSGKPLAVSGASPSFGGGMILVPLQAIPAGQSYTMTVNCTANNAGSNMPSFQVPVQASVTLSDTYGTDPVAGNNLKEVETQINNP